MGRVETNFKQTEAGLIPVDWEVKSLSKIGFLKKGKGIKKNEVLPDGIACIRYGELYTHHNEYIKTINSYISREVAKQSQKIETGDILFAGSGETREEIGKCATFLQDIEAYAGGDVIIMSPQNCDSLFLGFILNTPVASSQKAKSGQGDAVVHLYPRDIAKILIPLPPTKTEQTAIANALSDADLYIESLEKLIDKKQKIKQGAMQQLLKPKPHWELKKLGEVAEYKNGKTLEKFVVEDGEFFLITLNSIDIKGSLKTNHLTINRSDNFLERGDLVMVLSDVAHGNFLGLTDVIPEKNKYALNQRMGALKNLKEVLPKFLSYYINLHQAYFKSCGKGSSQQNLGKEDILSFDVYLPDRLEQECILNILSDMDSEITALTQKLTKAKAIKQGMMQQLLTGKIRLI